MNKKLIVICGPTASGKTKLSLKLAQKFNGVIISADSRQIYKEMNIGTDKPYLIKYLKSKRKNSLWIINGIKHFMIDIVKPNQEFTLADYQTKVFKILKKIYQENELRTQKGKLPIVPFLVGGTGLYIQAIIDGLIIPQVAPDKKLRSELEKLNKQELFKQLKKLDPEIIKSIDQNNKRRLIRALEVCLITKKPFSWQRKKKPLDIKILQLGLSLPRQKLYQKIDQRVDKMIKEGLVEETKKLIAKYDPELPSMSGIGYKEIIRYLNNEINLEEAKKLIKYRTHRLARQQITWFHRDKRIKWCKNKKQALQLVKKFIESN